MTKEVEALERLKTAPNFMGGTAEYKSCTKSETLLIHDYEIIKQALQRLEAIDNANPSEALEKLDKVNNYLNDVYDYKEIKAERRKDIDSIKQALIKAQEQEKVLEIIKKKNVMVFLLKVSKSIDEYNFHTSEKDELTQEEFELLKRYFK